MTAKSSSALANAVEGSARYCLNRRSRHGMRHLAEWSLALRAVCASTSGAAAALFQNLEHGRDHGIRMNT